MAASHQKTLVFGLSRLNSHESAYHAASRNSSDATPTMMSHARWTTFTSALVGRWFAGTVFSPLTTVEVPVDGSDRIEASPGIANPPTTWPCLFRWPRIVSG